MLTKSLRTMSKVNYIYAELTSESKDKLKSILPFSFPNQHGNYITLDWDVDSTNYKDIIGKTFSLFVDTIFVDQFAEAIIVDLSKTNLRSVNKHPHITWSISDGWNAYYSNYMLEVKTGKTINFEPVEISVVVKDDLF
jgi:Fungal tRNA ligase phosphodiesterase domain